MKNLIWTKVKAWVKVLKTLHFWTKNLWKMLVSLILTLVSNLLHSMIVRGMEISLSTHKISMATPFRVNCYTLTLTFTSVVNVCRSINMDSSRRLRRIVILDWVLQCKLIIVENKNQQSTTDPIKVASLEEGDSENQGTDLVIKSHRKSTSSGPETEYQDLSFYSFSWSLHQTSFIYFTV